MAGSTISSSFVGLSKLSKSGEDRGARVLSERLHHEFGVPVGILDPKRGEWITWAGIDLNTAGARPNPPEIREDVVSCSRACDPGQLWLTLPVPAESEERPRYAMALFSDASGRWAERALQTWGESVSRRLEAEAASHASGHPSRAADLVERLISRLRVSDAPERFQKRAATAVREALDVEVVAWIPGSSREPVLVAGSLSDVGPEDLRALIREHKSEAIRICNHAKDGAAVRRFVVAAADSQGESGWLLAANPRDNRPFSGEADLLSTVASLIATQRSNARIYGDLKELLFGVIRALTAAIDAKDRYTSGHSERVARIAVRIGQQLGMSPHEQGDLYLMGLLHDVGKIGVEDGVLKKPGKLTSDEYIQVQAHVRIGVHILSDLKKLQHLLPGVEFHHESYDGTGYPLGLKGDQIPLPARILAVADAFDAMSSTRPYRRRLDTRQIDEIFKKGAGVQWDERVVDALNACRPDLDRIRQKGLGESLYQVINETLGRK